MWPFLKVLTLVSTLVLAHTAHADWQLTQNSSVSYVSIKNNAIAEHNAFSGVTGGLADNGLLTVSIDLSSLETGVDIRNQRMRDVFFEVIDYPEAVVTAQLNDQELAHMASGTPLVTTKTVSLSLHGITVQAEAQVLAVSVGDRVWVSTLQPILISAGDFGLGEGVSALQALAGLNAIAGVVPVSVDLRLQQR